MPALEDISDQLLSGHMQTQLKKLYPEDDISRQLDRARKLITMFEKHFGIREAHLFSTSGRTEIGGNHTDHNHGRVLAGAVNLDTLALVHSTVDNRIILFSEGYPNPFDVNLNTLEMQEGEKGTTAALIRGIASRFKAMGFSIGGFKGVLQSDVMVGSGLSSSASIEVLIGTILNHLYNDGEIEPVRLAKIGQYAENVYFGKPCGLMDQTACAVGGIVTIDFKDPENPDVRRVHFDFESQAYRLLIVDTGGNHADLTGDYAAIPEEMKRVSAALGKTVCREIDRRMLLQELPKLRQLTGDRAVLRAYHFIADNERVGHQVAALEAGDFFRFLDLVNASGRSSFQYLQNIYSVHNIREQGVSLALVLTEQMIEELGEGACRVHGGGFAGTIQAFLPKHAVDAYRRLIEPVFGPRSVNVMMIRPAGTLKLL